MHKIPDRSDDRSPDRDDDHEIAGIGQVFAENERFVRVADAVLARETWVDVVGAFHHSSI